MAYKGNLNIPIEENHLIVIDDPELIELGIPAFSKKGLDQLVNDPSTYKGLEQFLLKKKGNDACASGELDPQEIKDLFLGKSFQPIYGKFNLGDKKYEASPIPVSVADGDSTISDLIDQHESVINNIGNFAAVSDSDFAQVIQDINNSPSGCLNFTTDYGIAGRVYFQSPKNKDSRRLVVSAGDPILATSPRRATGGKYTFSSTEKKQLNDSAEDGFGQIGCFDPYNDKLPKADTDVVGRMRLNYNKALGYFESGSQTILARLTDDLDPVDARELDMDAVDVLKPKDLYDKESPSFISAFTSSFAMPLSAHNGNPHTHGPNIVNSTTYEKEYIRVVNRAGRGWKKGELVLCTLIDNEWIVHDFGPAQLSQGKVQLGKWQFVKMLADTDAYFADDRRFWLNAIFYENGANPYDRAIKGTEYPIRMRARFYESINSYDSATLKLDGLNNTFAICSENVSVINSLDKMSKTAQMPDNVADLTDFQPSTRYVQTSAFDLLGKHMGGNNDLGNIIGRTNNQVSPDPLAQDQRAEFAQDVPFWFGPILPDGYASATTLRLLSSGINAIAMGSGIVTGGLLDVTNNSCDNNMLSRMSADAPPDDDDDDGDDDGDDDDGSDDDDNDNATEIPPVFGADDDDTVCLEELFMFANRFDYSLAQLPAEYALNASPSGLFGYPVEHISQLVYHERSSTNAGSPIAKAYNTFLRSDSNRFHYLATPDGASEFLDLQPINKTNIQFSPLQYVFAGHADKSLSKEILEMGDTHAGQRIIQDYGNTWDMARELLAKVRSQSSFWGNMLTREEALTSHSFSADSTGFIPKGHTNIVWDKYIFRKPRNHVISPYAFYQTDPRGDQYDGANLMHITYAKNTARIGSAGVVQLNCTFDYGLPYRSRSMGGQVTPISALPIMGMPVFGGGTNPIRSYTNPQWGNEGSTLQEYSGGLTLYASLFDHWPEEDTICDPRYDCPLHFLPGKLHVDDVVMKTQTEDVGKVYEGDWVPAHPSGLYTTAKLAQADYERTIDVPETTVDFRVPTYGHPFEPDVDNTIVPEGQLINRVGVATGSEYTETVGILRPKGEWRINPICRGMMVTSSHGFRYWQRVIGLNPDDYTVVTRGAGMLPLQKVEDSTNNFVLEVNSDDTGDGTSFTFTDKGEGFSPSSFDRMHTRADENGDEQIYHGVLVTIPGVGEDTEIVFHTGLVWDKPRETIYPKFHGKVLCTEPDAAEEEGYKTGSKSTSIGILERSPDGLYDIFLHFAHDVTFVDWSRGADTIGLLQQVNLNIGAA